MSLLLDALKQAEENKRKAGDGVIPLRADEETSTLVLEENTSNTEPTVEITLEKQKPELELEEPKESQIVEPSKSVHQSVHDNVNVTKKSPLVNVLSVGQKKKKGSNYKVLGLIVVALLSVGVAGLFFLDQGQSPNASYKEIVAAQRKSLAKQPLAVDTSVNKPEAVIAINSIAIAEEQSAITETHQEVVSEPELPQGQTENPSAIHVKKRTTSSNLLSQLNDAYSALVGNDLVRAQRIYSQVLKRRPKQVDALLGLANIERQWNNESVARQLYQQVLRIDESNSIAQIGLLQTYGQQNAISRQQVLEELITKYSNNPEVHLALGHALSEQSKWMLAQESYFKAFSLNPASTVYAYNLAVSLDRLEKYGAAKTYYEKALRLNEQAVKPINLQRVTNRLTELSASYE